MGKIEEAVHDSADALHLNRFSVTPVNDWWVITERATPNEVRYWSKRDTQQDAINEVLQLLGYGDGEEFGDVGDVDGIDAWNQPEPAMDLLQRIMAAYDGGEEPWCCEMTNINRHNLNCLLDQARKLCGPGD